MARGYEPGELTDRLKDRLPNPVTNGRHLAAMEFDDVPAFMAELRAQEGVAARALEFCILTAARTGEALGAKWDEVDFGKRKWTVPASRMKTGKKVPDDHVVPLSNRAIEILEGLPREANNPFVFVGERPGRSIHIGAMFKELRAMRSKSTVHGFRASFRTWAAARTNFAREVAEQALAHTVGDATERAYLRDTLLEKRRALMEAWAAYCSGEETADNVVQLRSSASMQV